MLIRRLLVLQLIIWPIMALVVVVGILLGHNMPPTHLVLSIEDDPTTSYTALINHDPRTHMSHQTRIPHNWQMVWTSDGCRVAMVAKYQDTTLVAEASNQTAVYVYRADTSDEASFILPDVGRFQGIMRWSPDEEWLALAQYGNRNAQPYESARGTQPLLYFLNAQTGMTRNLTGQFDDIDGFFWLNEPQTANALIMAYTGDGQQFTRVDVATGEQTIWDAPPTVYEWSALTNDTNGDDLRLRVQGATVDYHLTFDATTAGIDDVQSFVDSANQQHGIRWRDDARQLFFVAQDNDALAVDAYRAYLVTITATTPDGQRATLHELDMTIAYSPGSVALNPVWSPDANWLAIYQQRTTRNGVIDVVNLETRQHTATLDHIALQRAWQWSPDSRWLATYQGGIHDKGYLIYDVQGDTVYHWHSDDRLSQLVGWTSDGHYVAYAINDRPNRLMLFEVIADGVQLAQQIPTGREPRLCTT